MALIISTKGNTAFRSEDVVCIAHLFNIETNRLSKDVNIILKSGRDLVVNCKTVKEAKEFKDTIIEILKKEY